MSRGYASASREGTLLNLRVSPGAKRSSVESAYGKDALRIKVAAPPVDGRANAGLERFLAGLLGVRRSAAEVVRGACGRDKTVLVRGVEPDGIREALGRHLA